MSKQYFIHIILLILVSTTSVFSQSAQVCANGVLSVSASGDETTGSFVLEYVLVCDGTIYGPNTTGNFDFDALGILPSSNCTVYAVNHDGTETFANWPITTGGCLEFIQRPVVIQPNIYNHAITICDGSSATINGIDFYSTSGIYTETLSGVNCDSIVVLDLTVTNCPPISACENEVINVSVSGANTAAPYELEYVLFCEGTVQAVNTNGIFDLNALGIQTTDGCSVYAVNHDGNEDYSSWPLPLSSCITTINLNLIVNPNDAVSVNETSCDPTEIGTTTQTLSNQFGCDSIVTTITTSPPNGNLYGLYIADPSNYHKVNPQTGAILASFPIQALSGGWINSSFTVNQTSARLHWVTENLNLSELNIQSGVQSNIASSINSLPFFWSLRFYDGFLYTISHSADYDKTLVRINPTTGAIDASFTPIEINGTSTDDILIQSSSVIDPNTGIYYIPVDGNRLLAFDINAGTGNAINLSGYVNATSDIGLLEINHNTGEMYALRGFTDLVQITSSGVVSLVKTIASGSGFANPSSAFDSENGLYFFQAESGCVANHPLITIDVATGQEWCSNPLGGPIYQMEFLNCTSPTLLRAEK